MVVDAGDTGVLLHLFLANVASLRHEEEKLLKMWAFFLKAQYCRLTREYKNAYSTLLATSPNAEGLKTNHHNKNIIREENVQGTLHTYDKRKRQ